MRIFKYTLIQSYKKAIANTVNEIRKDYSKRIKGVDNLMSFKSLLGTNDANTLRTLLENGTVNGEKILSPHVDKLSPEEYSLVHFMKSVLKDDYNISLSKTSLREIEWKYSLKNWLNENPQFTNTKSQISNITNFILYLFRNILGFNEFPYWLAKEAVNVKNINKALEFILNNTNEFKNYMYNILLNQEGESFIQYLIEDNKKGIVFNKKRFKQLFSELADENSQLRRRIEAYKDDVKQGSYKSFDNYLKHILQDILNIDATEIDEEDIKNIQNDKVRNIKRNNLDKFLKIIYDEKNPVVFEKYLKMLSRSQKDNPEKILEFAIKMYLNKTSDSVNETSNLNLLFEKDLLDDKNKDDLLNLSVKMKNILTQETQKINGKVVESPLEKEMKEILKNSISIREYLYKYFVNKLHLPINLDFIENIYDLKSINITLINEVFDGLEFVIMMSVLYPNEFGRFLTDNWNKIGSKNNGSLNLNKFKVFLSKIDLNSLANTIMKYNEDPFSEDNPTIKEVSMYLKDLLSEIINIKSMNIEENDFDGIFKNVLNKFIEENKIGFINFVDINTIDKNLLKETLKSTLFIKSKMTLEDYLYTIINKYIDVLINVKNQSEIKNLDNSSIIKYQIANNLNVSPDQYLNSFADLYQIKQIDDETLLEIDLDKLDSKSTMFKELAGMVHEYSGFKKSLPPTIITSAASLKSNATFKHQYDYFNNLSKHLYTMIYDVVKIDKDTGKALVKVTPYQSYGTYYYTNKLLLEKFPSNDLIGFKTIKQTIEDLTGNGLNFKFDFLTSKVNNATDIQTSLLVEFKITKEDFINKYKEFISTNKLPDDLVASKVFQKNAEGKEELKTFIFKRKHYTMFGRYLSREISNKVKAGFPLSTVSNNRKYDGEVVFGYNASTIRQLIKSKSGVITLFFGKKLKKYKSEETEAKSELEQLNSIPKMQYDNEKIDIPYIIDPSNGPVLNIPLLVSKELVNITNEAFESNVDEEDEIVLNDDLLRLAVLIPMDFKATNDLNLLKSGKNYIVKSIEEMFKNAQEIDAGIYMNMFKAKYRLSDLVLYNGKKPSDVANIKFANLELIKSFILGLILSEKDEELTNILNDQISKEKLESNDKENKVKSFKYVLKITNKEIEHAIAKLQNNKLTTELIQTLNNVVKAYKEVSYGNNPAGLFNLIPFDNLPNLSFTNWPLLSRIFKTELLGEIDKILKPVADIVKELGQDIFDEFNSNIDVINTLLTANLDNAEVKPQETKLDVYYLNFEDVLNLNYLNATNPFIVDLTKNIIKQEIHQLLSKFAMYDAHRLTAYILDRIYNIYTKQHNIELNNKKSLSVIYNLDKPIDSISNIMNTIINDNAPQLNIFFYDKTKSVYRTLKIDPEMLSTNLTKAYDDLIKILGNIEYNKNTGIENAKQGVYASVKNLLTKNRKLITVYLFAIDNLIKEYRERKQTESVKILKEMKNIMFNFYEDPSTQNTLSTINVDQSDPRSFDIMLRLFVAALTKNIGSLDENAKIENGRIYVDIDNQELYITGVNATNIIFNRVNIGDPETLKKMKSDSLQDVELSVLRKCHIINSEVSKAIIYNSHIFNSEIYTSTLIDTKVDESTVANSKIIIGLGFIDVDEVGNIIEKDRSKYKENDLKELANDYNNLMVANSNLINVKEIINDKAKKYITDIGKQNVLEDDNIIPKNKLNEFKIKLDNMIFEDPNVLLRMLLDLKHFGIITDFELRHYKSILQSFDPNVMALITILDNIKGGNTISSLIINDKKLYGRLKKLLDFELIDKDLILMYVDLDKTHTGRFIKNTSGLSSDEIAILQSAIDKLVEDMFEYGRDFVYARISPEKRTNVKNVKRFIQDIIDKYGE